MRNGGALLKFPSSCLVLFICILRSRVSCAAGPNSWPGTTGRSRSVFLQVSDNRDCASQTWWCAWVSVDYSLPNSLDMNANAYNEASLILWIEGSSPIDWRDWESANLRWDSEFPMRPMHAALLYAWMRSASVILHWGRGQRTLGLSASSGESIKEAINGFTSGICPRP